VLLENTVLDGVSCWFCVADGVGERVSLCPGWPGQVETGKLRWSGASQAGGGLFEAGFALWLFREFVLDDARHLYPVLGILRSTARNDLIHSLLNSIE
jgi:hypothetical protein